MVERSYRMLLVVLVEWVIGGLCVFGENLDGLVVNVWFGYEKRLFNGGLIVLLVLLVLLVFVVLNVEIF